MKKPTYQYIVITDPNGCIKEGQYLPMTHRAIIVDRQGFYGMESIGKKFESEQSFMAFAQAIISASSGTHSNGFSWKYDGDPVADLKANK